jgi:hypothetical protein
MTDRDNSGTLGRNERKEKASQPTHTGQCLIDGKPYWISAWVKDGREGSKFFSLAFNLKTEKRPDGDRPRPTSPAQDFDDEIPF